jgi:FkbM family methyltransferase
MIQTIKARISEVVFNCGLDLRLASSVPFGVRWYRDIQFFPNGSKLDTVLDVGANTGQTALTVVRYFPKSRVYSFEPVPSTFQELVWNIAKHPNIEAICCAMGDSQGSARITTEPLSGSNTLLLDVGLNPNPKSLLQVQVNTIDAFCAEREIQRVSLLKIDTEGYEINVLRGAERLLAEGRIDFILAECDFFRRSSEPHGDFSEIFKYISSRGFHVVSMYTGGVDDLGWIWGDALFRESSRSKPGRVACSPIVKVSAPTK